MAGVATEEAAVRELEDAVRRTVHGPLNLRGEAVGSWGGPQPILPHLGHKDRGDPYSPPSPNHHPPTPQYGGKNEVPSVLGEGKQLKTIQVGEQPIF